MVTGAPLEQYALYKRQWQQEYRKRLNGSATSKIAVEAALAASKSI